MIRGVSALNMGVILGLAGCALVPALSGPDRPAPPTGSAPLAAAVLPRADAQATSDRGTDAAPAMTGGRTVASLGTPAESGLWLKTPLVRRTGRGRVTDLATGRAVTLELVPLSGPAGSGSRMSVAAYRALNLPLTALPEVEVVPTGG